jgi:hypothetical protein
LLVHRQRHSATSALHAGGYFLTIPQAQDLYPIVPAL